jgi:hypothetical protein
MFHQCGHICTKIVNLCTTIVRKHKISFSHNQMLRTTLQASRTALGILSNVLDGFGYEGAPDFLLPALLAGLVLVIFCRKAILALFVAILASCGIGQSG